MIKEIVEKFRNDIDVSLLNVSPLATVDIKSQEFIQNPKTNPYMFNEATASSMVKYGEKDLFPVYWSNGAIYFDVDLKAPSNTFMPDPLLNNTLITNLLTGNSSGNTSEEDNSVDEMILLFINEQLLKHNIQAVFSLYHLPMIAEKIYDNRPSIPKSLLDTQNYFYDCEVGADDSETPFESYGNLDFDEVAALQQEHGRKLKVNRFRPKKNLKSQ